MSSLVGAKIARAMAAVISALLVAGGCGGDDAVRTAGTTTDRSVASSWFRLAAVQEVSDGPCAPGAAPSRDGTKCYELADEAVDASSVAGAAAIEDEASCEPAPGEIVCVAAASGPTTSSAARPGTWSVQFALTDAAITSFNALAYECFQRAEPCPTGQVAIVVDGQVIDAPAVEQPRYERDSFVLSGGFDRAAAERLAGRFSE